VTKSFNCYTKTNHITYVIKNLTYKVYQYVQRKTKHSHALNLKINSKPNYTGN